MKFPIESQTSHTDKESLTLIKNCIIETLGAYNYCEIGSYKGGSLYPHLVEPACKNVLSIDLRPLIQKDERGEDFVYIGNSTESMCKTLSKFCTTAELSKLLCCEGSSDSVVAKVAASDNTKYNLFFIDGEHTNEWCLQDFESCWQIAADRAVFVFHDASTVYKALEQIMESAEKLRIIGYPMPDDIFVIEKDLHIHQMTEMYLYQIKKGQKAYFHGLNNYGRYREFYTKFRPLRTLVHFLRGRNVFWA